MGDVRAIYVAVIFALGVTPQTSPTAPVAGTASVGGVVVQANDSSQPVRRAIVKLSRNDELSYSAITDDAGRFVLTSLPAGSYTLTASKAAYLTSAFGALRPGRIGTPLVLQNGQSVSDLRISMTRGAVITGTIRDASGEPSREVPIFAVRLDPVPMASQVPGVTAAVEFGTSDDDGVYRLYGLAPGAYIVGATPRLLLAADLSVPTAAQIDAQLQALQRTGSGGALPFTQLSPERYGYAPVFHASATSPERAIAITLAPGEERRGVDVSLVFAPLATIEGVVVGITGAPVSAVTLTITRPGPSMPLSLQGLPPTTRPAADGSFRYINVTPGTYTLSARSQDGSSVWATTTTEVNGSSVAGVTLRLRPGLTMAGRVAFDAAVQTPPSNLAQVGVTMTDSTATALAANVQSDGAFVVRNLRPGPYVLSARVSGSVGPTAWWLRSAMLDGRDLLDSPLMFGDVDVANVVMTLTDRHTEIAGTLQTEDGTPAMNVAVVALPEDRALWTSPRRLRTTRPAADGRYAFTDLPPGTYLLTALTDIDEDNWKNTEFLSALAPGALKVTLGEGERKTQDLRIAGK